jgi:uncharacterized protein
VTQRVRLVGPDVTRAIALIGVVAMNYHAYLNNATAASGPDSNFFERLFEPWTGVLATRFAATFVLVAGVGVSLMSRSGRADVRWRLARRGVLLYATGYFLNWIWDGTIIFYYGAMFVVAAIILPLRSRWLAAIGVTSAVAAAGIQWWVTDAIERGHDVSWLISPGTAVNSTPRGLLFDTFVNGTHPLLPWLAFLCAGMIVGRILPNVRYLPVAMVSLGVTAVTYLANHLLTSGQADNAVRVMVWSTNPFDRGLMYTAGTLGTSLAALCLISWLAERSADHPVTLALQSAGQMTLSIYVAHVLTYNFVVHWMGWVQPDSGLGAALLFAVTFWTIAIMTAWWWVRFVGMGPLERVYRRFGD